MNVYYHTFGCKVNQYETENIKEAMEAKGYKTTTSFKEADICIINSCTVTSSADLKLRQLIHKLRKENESAVIVVCGCYSQVLSDPEKVLPEADIIVGTANKTQIPDYIDEYIASHQRIVAISKHKKTDTIEPMQNNGSGGKTRAIIKIQDGCDRFCTYCIIPFARGRIRSKSIRDIEHEASQLSQNHKEIILVGINLSCYGQDLDNVNLANAVEAVARANQNVRIRLGSLEPELLTEDIIRRLAKCKNLCEHFHLSLQSGCDKTLKEMGRKYDKEEYFTLVESLRKHFPSCAITTDIMVGFPGETDEDFLESLEFVKKIGFAQVHIFPYSKRSGTVAAKRTDQIPQKVKENRAKEMLIATNDSEQAYLMTLIGTTQEVLFEKDVNKHYHIGHTRSYVTVKVKRLTDSLWREIKEVKITAIEGSTLWGEII